MKKSDLRVQRTLNALKEAFIALVIEKGFDQISVRDLCQTARINRATFYRHYSDKYDLADRLTELLFVDQRIEEPIASLADVHQSIQGMFDHVAEYAAFYLAMLGPRGVPGFADRVRDDVEKEMNRLFGENSAPEVPPELAIRYLAAGQVGFIRWWLENDMPLSSAEAAAYLATLHQQGGIRSLGL
ncbi:MAG: TetR/AcrR family transcriptional regulator [Ardenticatenaceae bacterium]|nr:TetR/AcrR family transcriptional regulator [Ardenticatenaceae bacterium]